jgi:redox-sensitive bicupin YhaK (pirin superfamily)
MRGIDRVEDGVHAGPDAEVDDKWLHVRPGDPARTDPFLVLSEDRFTSPGFEWHPHRGIETVTVVLDGVLEHEDDAGGAGVLYAGDAQWMTAGRGIVHREVAGPGAHVHMLQLWLDLPPDARSAAPGHQQLRAAGRPRLARPGGEVDVLAGTVDGVTGPARPVRAVQVVLVTLDPGAALDLPIPVADRALVLVVDGAAEVAGQTVRARQTAWSEPASASGLALRGGSAGARLLVASAQGRDGVPSEKGPRSPSWRP